METTQHFQYLCYHREYFVNRKYVGYIKLDTPDREVQGYNGRQYGTATEDIVLDKKVVKKGQEYYTECITICGRTLK